MNGTVDTVFSRDDRDEPSPFFNARIVVRSVGESGRGRIRSDEDAGIIAVGVGACTQVSEALDVAGERIVKLLGGLAAVTTDAIKLYSVESLLTQDGLGSFGLFATGKVGEYAAAD